MTELKTATINGVELSGPELISLRVAVTSFHSHMFEKDVLGSDEHGLFMQESYKENCEKILKLMKVL